MLMRTQHATSSQPAKRPLRPVKYPSKVTVALTAETFAKVESTADMMGLPLAEVCRQVIESGIASFRTSEKKRRYTAKNHAPKVRRATTPDAD